MRGGLQGLALFNFDSVLAFLCASASLCVGHAEDVIGLHAAVDTTVPWDGVAQLRGLVTGYLHAVENAESILVGLLVLGGNLGLSGTELGLGALESLLLDNWVSLAEAHTVELVDGVSRDWLLSTFIVRLFLTFL